MKGYTIHVYTGMVSWRVGGVAGKIRLLPSEVNVKNLCQYFIFMTEGVCGDLHDVIIKYTASFLVINIVASLYEISYAHVYGNGGGNIPIYIPVKLLYTPTHTQVEPYGSSKAKVSLSTLDRLKDQTNGR